jgi:exosortase/archaeosortase family protein
MKSVATISPGEPAGMLPGLGLRFALTFVAIAAALFTLYGFPFELFGAKQDWLHGYLAAYAQLAGGALGLFERGLIIDDTLIQGRFALQIVRNCDAADVNILFVSALCAFPAKVRFKAPLVLAGVAALVAANVLRICSLYYVGVYAPARFKVVHEEVWPLLLVMWTVGVFVLCVRRLELQGQRIAT